MEATLQLPSTCLPTKLWYLCLEANNTWKGFSPVWTSWCRFSFELSTKALPHSAHTCTRGPWVCRCFLMAELSLNIFVQPLKRTVKTQLVDKLALIKKALSATAQEFKILLYLEYLKVGPEKETSYIYLKKVIPRKLIIWKHDKSTQPNPKQKNPPPPPPPPTGYYEPYAVKWITGQPHGEDVALREANEQTKQKHLRFQGNTKDRMIAHG